MPRVTDGSSWCLSGWLAGNIVLCFPFWFDPHEHPSTPKTNRHTDKQGNKQTYEQTKTDQPFHTKMHTTLFLYRSQAAGQPVSQAASQPARQATLRTLPPKKRFQEKKREHPAVGGRFLIKALFKSCVSLRKNATFLKTYCFVVIKRMISYNFKNKKHQIHVREHGFGVWGCRGVGRPPCRGGRDGFPIGCREPKKPPRFKCLHASPWSRGWEGGKPQKLPDESFQKFTVKNKEEIRIF